jgi:TGS domain
MDFISRMKSGPNDTDVRVYLARFQIVDLGSPADQTDGPRPREADEPVALPSGATAFDVANLIHGDVAERMEGALVWRASARFDG